MKQAECECGQPHQVGKHLWALCSECGRLVKLTGWTRGWHICTELRR